MALRLAAIPLLGADPSNQTLFEYGKIAWNIVQGYGFSFDFNGRYPLKPTAYSPAGYCYFLVPWFAVFGLNLTGPRIMNAALLAAVCWFIYKIGERLVNRRVGLIAAGVWAIYPEMIFLGLRVAIENGMFLPMTWLLWRAQKTSIECTGRSALGTGALLGLSAWINPSLQLLGVIIPAHWWLNGILKGGRGVKLLGLFILGAILVISPWTIRNYIKLGAFVPLRSAFAYNIWRGNHPGATGTVRELDFKSVEQHLSPDYAAYVEAHMSPDEIQRDRFCAAEVKRFILQHPSEYLRLTTTRFLYYWWKDPTHLLTSNFFYLAPWMGILIFGALGVWRVRKDWRKWSLWWLQILGFTVLFSLTIVVPRYRMPIYPALFLLAGVGVSYFIGKIEDLAKNKSRLKPVS